MISGRLRACASPAPPLHAPRNIPLRARAHPRSRALAAIEPVMVTAADTATNAANPRATATIPDSPASATLNLGVAKGIVKPSNSPRKPADPAAAAAAIVNGAVASSHKPPAVTTASPHNLATKTSLLSATTASPRCQPPRPTSPCLNGLASRHQCVALYGFGGAGLASQSASKTRLKCLRHGESVDG